MENNAEQPAYPASASWSDENPQVIQVQNSGLTKREYFAGLAMQGMITALTKFRHEVEMENIIVNRPADIAELSILYADNLLSQLSQLSKPYENRI